MQADPGEDRVPARTEAGFPTPPPTPKKLLPNGKAVFPLFDSLLSEGVNDQQKRRSQPAPATAPILISTKPYLARDIQIQSPTNSKSLTYTNGKAFGAPGSFWVDPMAEKAMEEGKEVVQKLSLEETSKTGKAGGYDENIQPIKLQDPPKPKLKRQLSIGTVEKTERERTPKKTYIPQDNSFTARMSCEQPWTPYVDPNRDEVDGSSTSSKEIGSGGVDKMPAGMSYPVSLPQRTHSITEPLQSPHYFNLKDIELTSPFLNPNIRRKSKERDDHIFIFPEAADERGSPTKQSPVKSWDDTYHGAAQAKYPMQSDPVRYIDTVSPSSNQAHRSGSVSRADRVDSAPRGSNQTQAPTTLPTYVTKEGFKWPAAATISEPPPFSPRVVTAYPRPTVQQSHDSEDQPLRQNEEIAKLQERIKLLEKEYERAKAIYMPKQTTHSQFSPGSREIQEILRRSALRSISDIERSPNEKEIRRLEAEVKNRYERSVSDPTFSPRQRQQRFVQQPSPLGRQNSFRHDVPEHGVTDDQALTHLQSIDRWRESWQSDVRRQLFSRQEYQPEYDPLPTPTPESVFLEDVQLPDEVAKFFHSKSFHPEDLENLKGILKRSQDHRSQQHTSTEEKCSLEGVNRDELSTESFRYQELSGGTLQRDRDFDLQYHTSPEKLGRLIGHGSLHPSIVQSKESREEHPRYTEAHRGLYSTFEDMRQYFGSHRLVNTCDAENRPFGRARSIGDIDVRISCESITEKVKQAKEVLKDLEHSKDNCHCNRIEQEILAMTNEAFARIRRMDATEESFLKFSEELNEANTSVYKSLEILCGIKCMCKYGRTLDEIYSGSIVFRMNCPNLYALEDLWESYKSGDLEQLISNIFVTKDLKDKFNAADIKLKVSISWDEYKQCKNELEMVESGLFSSPSPVRSPFKQISSTTSPIIHCRSRSEPIVNSSSSAGGQMLYKPTMSPFRERICSDSTVELSPRRAFQEINVGRGATRLSLSPSKKTLLEGIFGDYDAKRSPNLSPRRKSLGMKSPLEHENVHPENRKNTDSPNCPMYDRDK